MNSQALRFLKNLMATPTPSGSEEAGQDLMSRYMRQYADQVKTDVNGNVHGILNPGAKSRIMLAGHCDEIGLMVQYIDDKGFIYVSMLGGIHAPLLQAERIVIQGRNGPVPGVIGVKPIHLMRGDKDAPAPIKIHELWVDIGAKNKKDAEKAISVGDVATISSGWIDMRNNLVACRGMDNRIGAFIIADALRLLKGRRLKVAVHAVSTIQEEVGLRGATLAAFGVEPDVGLAVDVGFATDYPNMEPKITGEAKAGRGPILHCGPTYNKKVLELLKKSAKKARVKTQFQPEARGEGTDAFAIYMSRAGVPAGLISIPCRYIHSAVEMVSLRDVENAVTLMAEFILNLKGTERWR
jgi:endoglucanase